MQHVSHERVSFVSCQSVSVQEPSRRSVFNEGRVILVSRYRVSVQGKKA